MSKRKSTGISENFDINAKNEQEFVNYITVPSLESVSIANIIVQLWKHTDFREEILHHLLEFHCGPSICYSERDEKFLQITKNISKHLFLLPLPNILKEKARNVIRPIGLEIINWITSLGRDYWCDNPKTEPIDSICWTMQGTIDKAKSLQLHLDNENLPLIFNKACEYCLEDHIANLWEQMPKNTKENPFYSEHVYQGYDRHLVAYWICFNKNELPKLMNMIKPSDFKNIYNCNHSIYKNMFTLSVLRGKELAAIFFWNKLTDEEKNNNIIKWSSLAIEEGNIDNAEYTNIMCFLFTQMNDKEQQIEVFQKYSGQVLKALFLVYPWQTFVLPTIQLMWDSLDDTVYIDFLKRVLQEIQKPELTGTFFRELWCSSPVKFKKHFIKHIISSYKGTIGELWNLLDIEDVETIKLILNDADVEEKKQIIFSAIKSDKLFKLMFTERLSLFEIVIKECMVTEYEIKNGKENIVQEHGYALCCYWIHDDNWQAVEKILLWGFSSQDQVDTFKANLASRIVKRNDLEQLGYGKWSSFERFIGWCFKSAEDINKFKMDISPFEKMRGFTHDIIAYGYNFEFAEKFLVWCFPSEREICKFKKELMLSSHGIDMFNRFLNDFKVYDCEYSHWELVEKLAEWFHPFEKDVLIEFKEIFRDEYLSFNGLSDYTGDLDSFFFLLDRIHGFHDRDG